MKKCGILLPIFSLPSANGIGCFSKEAYEFVDFLVECQQDYWQILPLGTIGVGDSPYLSFSSYAGSRFYIDMEQLVEDGLLSAEDLLDKERENTGRVNYDQVRKDRNHLLFKAYQNFKPTKGYEQFKEEHKDWLEEYVSFMTERRTHEKEYYRFCQYQFLKQWLQLKSYANDKGVEIIGDLPFYVSLEGTAFKYHKELFKTDDNGEALVVGGCPPDAFAKDGQVWSNPVYDWEYHKKTGYQWWVDRLKHNFLLFDVLRLDHFRGFDEYYEIPATDETAVNGHWEKGPGYDMFEVLKEKLGDQKIIAEDLGFLTDSVKQLLADTNYPGMKILEFAFGAWDDSIYLPHKYEDNCVVYTGTHDNDTVIGWYETLSDEDRNFLNHYLDHSSIDRSGLINLDLISLALESRGDTVIIPLQDYLGLGSDARINTPSTVGHNWKWRVKKDQLNQPLKDTITFLTNKYRKQES